MTDADQSLHRAYRRLLLAYPGRFRRHHGTEILTTLLELAGPQQRRPGPADAWHLVASGLRQRFRLPAGRPLGWVAVVLVTLIVGAFGAAAGSWAGERTFASLPDGPVLAQQAVGAGETAVFERDSSPWLAAIFFTDTRVGTGWDVEQARQRFAAQGWTVGAAQVRDGLNSGDEADPGPLRTTRFQAERDGVQIQLRSYQTPRGGKVTVNGWATPTAAFLPLIVAGTLLGLAAGWLLAAALAYRILRSRRPRLAATVTGTSVLVLALPTLALYGNLMRAFRYAGSDDPAFTVHSAFSPGPYYPFGPQWLVPAMAVAGVVLAVAAAALARPGPAVLPEQTPATG